MAAAGFVERDENVMDAELGGTAGHLDSDGLRGADCQYLAVKLHLPVASG
jgi:hypothetical protein